VHDEGSRSLIRLNKQGPRNRQISANPQKGYNIDQQKKTTPMAAVEAGSNTGVQSGFQKLLAELRGYIDSGFITIEEVASLPQKDPKLSGQATNALFDDERPSVIEVNVSDILLQDMICVILIDKLLTYPSESSRFLHQLGIDVQQCPLEVP
jgi:hypothetical protein